MSLADKLLADLADDDEPPMPIATTSSLSNGIKQEFPSQIEPSVNIDSKMASSSMISKFNGYDSIKQVTKLYNSPDLNQIIADIEERNRMQVGEDFAHFDDKKKIPISKSQVEGPIETHPEYQLLVKANNIVAEIDDEIKLIDKFVRSKYSKRFPELTVADPMEYMLTVKLLGNNLAQAKTNEQLTKILDPKTSMLVSMTASTSRGVELSEEELCNILEACDTAIDLTNIKSTILSFVESRMTFIAPNMSVIVGASVAAKLLGLAGGLTQLCNMPSCNISVLGAPKSTSLGHKTSSLPPRMGVIYTCDLVQGVPKDILRDVRKRAVGMVANKIALAARCDASHATPDGEDGRLFREQIEKAIGKLLEPPPKKAAKPLPAPIDKSRKKRGGKRVRRIKERTAITEMRKAANRITFGNVEDDAYQEDLGFCSGQLGKTGKIRGPQVDEKTRVRISKGLQRNLQKYKSYLF